MTPDERHERLSSKEAIRSLATAFVDDSLARPVGALVAPAALAKEVVEGLRLLLASDSLQAAQLEAARRGRGWLREQPLTLGQLSGSAVEEAARDLASLPYVPGREILIFLLDREPMRLLLRELFLDALLTFGRKLRDPMLTNPVAKGLGGLGRFARDRARSTAFGAFATDVAGRLGDEVERQFERRALEFADAALSGLVVRLVDLLADPARAQQQASLRETLVDGIFALQTAEVAEELERSDPVKRSNLLRRGIAGWLASDEAEKRIRDVIEGALEGFAERPFGEVLEAWGLLEGYRPLAITSIERQIAPFAQGPAFRRWLDERLS